MNKVSNEVKELLDKLYNLRGEDSYILVEMEKERQSAEETKNRTTLLKQDLIEKIEKLNNDEAELAEQGAKLRDVLSNINIDEYSAVLNSLSIDFNPEEIKNKIDDTLPAKIEEVVQNASNARKELQDVEEEMNTSIMKIDELAVRKETELSNQEKLNEYFDLALSGNINITRDAITSLVSQFGFNEEEQRETAKIMMFPEDGLYEYDKEYQSENNHGKSISDVLIEAKESVSTPFGEIFQNNAEDDIKIEDNAINVDFTISDLLKSSEDDIIIQDGIQDTDEEEVRVVFTPVENEEVELTDNAVTENIIEEVKGEAPEETEVEEETMMELFRRLNLNEIMFAETELSDLINLEDKELVEKNVNILNSFNINLDIVSDNVNILSDTELEEKINAIIDTGKSIDDIYFNPSVIRKYSLEELNNAINLLKENGLDPKKVPLMAY